jgi:hypothetical protein
MGQAGSYWKGAAMVTDHVETLIVGAGQASLAMSHMLSRRGRPHLVLERGRLGDSTFSNVRHWVVVGGKPDIETEPKWSVSKVRNGACGATFATFGPAHGVR